MALIKNPPKLNGLQLRTLTILQQLGRSTETSTKNAEKGEVMISNLPKPHGNHFDCGDAVVLAKNASGLNNQGGWKALAQKGLSRAYFSLGIALTPYGVVDDTGLSEKFLMRSEH